MQRTKPPYRADHVGSILRSDAIKTARSKREKGEITAAQLKEIEDREVEKIVRKQEEVGLKLATDGEYRRSWWHLDFFWGLTGCEKIDLKKAKATGYKSLTYVTPDADVPTEFGLDETVSRYANSTAASAFVTGIRKNVDNCAKATSDAVTVKTTGSIAVGNIKGETWRAAYDTGGGKVFTYRIGIASNGSSAVYILFPVLKTLDVTNAAFTDVLIRAAERSTASK